MAWLPFLCLIAAIAVLTVLYSKTVGHIHRMVHQIDEALGIHEDRLNAYGDDMVQVAEILAMMSKRMDQKQKAEHD